jgi:DNA-binding CsgD family transcriptional regulator
MAKGDAVHALKDPAALTPYEQKLVNLKNRGLSYQEMSEALEGAAKVKTIQARYRIIKEKLALQEHSIK